MRIATLAEEPGMLDDVRRFLNRFLWRDFIDSRTFRRIVEEDPNHDPRYAYIALEGDSIEAVAIGVRRLREPASMVEAQRRLAWIKAMAAAPEKAGRLNEVLDALEDSFRREGVGQLRVSDYASWYLAPGVDVEYGHIYSVLAGRGYRRFGDCVNYEVDLARFYTPGRVAEMDERLRSSGVSIREGWVDGLEEWIEERFGPFWRVEAGLARRQPDGGVIVATKGGEVQGFSVYGALRPDFFGPIGVDPNVRGGGLGTVLLFRTLARMKEEGVRIATIPWTTHLGFYAQVPGVMGIRYFVVMGKDL